MTDQAEREPIRVLFVCTGNSARSIMAETLLRHHGGADFEVFSAGTDPRGVNPLTFQVLEEARLPTSGLRSKSVAELLGRPFDYVITVCDQARESCPFIRGNHQSLHWSFMDPAAATGTEDERLGVFRSVFAQISTRIGEFAATARRRAAGEPVTLR